MLMLVIMVVAAAFLVIIVVIVVMVVALLILIVVIMVMVVAAALLVIVILVVMMVLVLMLVLFYPLHHFAQHLLFHIVRTGNDVQKQSAAQLGHRGGDHRCLRIQSLHDGNRLFHLLRIGDIGSGEHHGSRIGNLVVEEFAEIAGVHLRLLRIHDGHSCVKLHVHIGGNRLHGTDNVGKLAYAAGLDDDAVRMIGIHHLFQRGLKITHQRAADAALVHLADLNAGLLQESAVDADLTEFILNQYYLLFPQRLIQKLLDKCGLARAQEAGNNIYLGHGICLLMIICICSVNVYSIVSDLSSHRFPESRIFSRSSASFFENTQPQ